MAPKFCVGTTVVYIGDAMELKNMRMVVVLIERSPFKDGYNCCVMFTSTGERIWVMEEELKHG
jgi:hypothetical protein